MGFFGVTGKLLTELLLAGNTLLLLLIVLSGSIEHRPIDRLYWLQADTSEIQGAQPDSRWTFWGLCGVANNRNSDCRGLSPAYPLSPWDNFNRSDLVPNDFQNNRDTYYFLSRFAFCFFWVALSFIGTGFLFYMFSWCSYSFTKVVFTMILVGCLFNMAAVACQTAVVVLARDKFEGANRHATIGAAMMGIAWASVVCSIITFFGTGISFIRRAWTAHKEYVEMQNYKQQALQYQGNKEETKVLDQPIVYDTNPELESNQYGADPVSASVPEGRRHQSGVKFFKVRRNKHVDEESL